MLGQAAQQEAFLLPFLGEQFSTRDVIYEGEEWEGVGTGHVSPAAMETNAQPPLLPPLGVGPSRGRPRAATCGAAPAARLHPGPESPARAANDGQESLAGSKERPDQRAGPVICHLWAHPSPLHQTGLLHFIPSILPPIMVAWTAQQLSVEAFGCLSSSMVPRKPSLCILLSCATRYLSCFSSPCLTEYQCIYLPS
jgi:hypothetical protein